MKRLHFSIGTGLALIFTLSTGLDFALHAAGIFPAYGHPMFQTGLVMLAFTYRMLFIIPCAWLTAIIAREQANKAVAILGITGSLIWLAGAIAMWNYTPAWYNIAGVVLGIPFALIGGKLYEIKKQKTIRYERAF